jgi:outer membrane receptor for ferrienterochelin and colicin
MIAALALCAFFIGSMLPGTAIAQTQTGTIDGTIVTQLNGLAIGGATVTLSRDGATVATTTADNGGSFTFANEPAGIYSILVAATGYQTTRVDTVVVTGGSTVVVRTPLISAGTSSAGITHEVIGSTKATGLRGNTLASSATIQTNLDPDQLLSQGFVKAADAIGQVPGVNLSGGPHTIGDDTTIDIRGMGPGEVRPLVDGHPIGPLGVYSNDYYNYVNSPFSLLQNIQVTVGSGATGLYGVDVIGGTIDFQTLNPTSKPQFGFYQTYGDDGTAGTILKATGTFGNFSYALGHAVNGTYGPLAPQLVFQGARPNNNSNLNNGGACTASNDLTTCNQLLNTYSVSGNYKVLNDLGKVRYNFTPTTALTFTAYAGNTLEDSTGNGDNDNLPYSTRLAQIQGSGQAGSGGCGANLYPVITDSNPNACYTAQQWAAASYGPDGGGEDRNRGTTLQDFDLSLTSQIGVNSISVSAYSDYYNFHKYSQAASGLDPTGTFYVGTGTYTDEYLTHGMLITDDITSSNNDLGFGYSVEHQQDSGNNLAYNSTGNYVYFVPQPILGEGDYSFFLRDNYTPTKNFGIYLNAWDRRSSVTQHTTFDPRLSFVYKPTTHDVVRLTGGEADGDPSIAIVQADSLTGFSNPSSLNPVCGGTLNPIASAGNPNLTAERSKDVEAAYGHRFWSDTSINVVAYVSSVSNQIFAGVFPITAQALANPVVAGSLGAYATKINSACPGDTYTAATVSQVLGLNGYFNASNALFRGIETTGRIRVTKEIALDYEYDIQSSQQFGEPLQVLQNNPYILDGGQILAIPLQKGSLTFDYSTGGFEGQLQGYWTGNNNTLNRPAYTFFNGFVSQKLTKNVSLGLSVYNVFNQNAQDYGYFGEQAPHVINQYNTQTNDPIQQYLLYGGTTNELLGIQSRLATLSLTIRI